MLKQDIHSPRHLGQEEEFAHAVERALLVPGPLGAPARAEVGRRGALRRRVAALLCEYPDGGGGGDAGGGRGGRGQQLSPGDAHRHRGSQCRRHGGRGVGRRGEEGQEVAIDGVSRGGRLRGSRREDEAAGGCWR